jgi:hypothetical protein
MKFVQPGINLPVDVLQIIARIIIPVMHELTAKPVIKTAVQAGNETLNHRARQQVIVFCFRQDCRIE